MTRSVVPFASDESDIAAQSEDRTSRSIVIVRLFCMRSISNTPKTHPKLPPILSGNHLLEWSPTSGRGTPTQSCSLVMIFLAFLS